MKTLSIDASTHSTGWALFDNATLIDYGCITASSDDLFKRIHKIIDNLLEVIKKHENIGQVILEEVRPENGLQNIKTQKALMYLQGFILDTVQINLKKTKVQFVYPSEWRKACGIKMGPGVRRESLKPRDIKFVEDKFGIKVNDDIADAIGIGWFYAKKFDDELNWD